MQYTTNFSLKKPQYADEADIEIINDNSDDIDNLIHQNRTMIAPAFDSTKAYVVGDPVVYLGELFVFIADKAAGAWDATKVEPTTAAEMGGGGASALADLDDVEITSPTVGQALLFDKDDKWKNQDLPDVSVTKEASGNPIEITGAAAAPMVKCVTEIQGSQDLHGYDKPWPPGAGKNKLKYPYKNTSGTINGITFTDNGDGTLTANGTSTARTIFYIHTTNENFAPPTGQYIFTKGFAYSDDTNVGIIIEAYNGSTYVKRLAQSYGLDAVNCNIDYDGFDSTEIYLEIKEGITVSNLLFKPMLRLSTVTATTFEPYSNICPITAYTEGEIEVRGRNLVDNTKYNGLIDGNCIYQSNNTRITNGNGNYNTAIFFKAGTYTIDIDGLDYATVITSKTGGFNSEIIDNFATEWHELPFTFTLTKDGYLYYSSRKSDNSVLNPDDYNVQIERGNIAHAYEEYITPIAHTTTYPSAIYRGSEDCVEGEVTSEWLTADPTTDGTMSYNGTSSYSVHYTWRASNIKKNGKTNFISNAFGVIESGDVENKIIGRDNSDIIEFLLPLSIGNNLTAAKAYIASYGTVVAYELATPTTSSVTPTNLPIKSLSGYNHIESSTGDMEIEYISGNYQALVDLIQSSSHVYSTAEQIVGKWIDGKDLFEKTIVIQNFSASTADSGWYYGTVNLADYGINPERLFPQQGETYIVLQDTTPRIPIYIDWQGGTNLYLYFLGSRSGTLTVVVRYTKVTVSRSLNAPLNTQKAQIEPLSEKEEEVPTEKEKAVETPVEEKTEEENEEER